ncbi:MAG: EamA family transporter [Rhodocyclaceae bacterium]|nr:EamA family transporter [Rhodocyclaceae bacterium]MBX3668607.1 EamA family transporter [Rhodocyclaceae bacterium]
MNAISLVLILSGVMLNACAQLLLKASTNAIGHFDFQLANLLPIGWRFATQPFFVGGMACYVLSLVIWVMGLSRVPVSIAYPMLSIGYVVNAVIAHFWLGESVTLTRAMGIGFILLGVWLVARS